MITIFHFVLTAFASTTATQVTITPLPGTTPPASIPGWIENFYTLALAFAGILAFGAIVYGGVRYAIGHGNPSSESEGKSWIQNALLGLLLLAAAWIILATVNPQIVTLSIPGLPQLQVTTATTGGGGVAAPSGPQIPQAPQVSGLNCKDGPCVPLIGVQCKNGCSVDQAMAPIIQCIQSNAPSGIIVTEAMPTSSPHLSTCHNNGCCVDMTVASVSSCVQVTNLISTAQSCGARVLNEYFKPIEGESCGGVNTEFSTGNHLHITGC